MSTPNIGSRQGEPGFPDSHAADGRALVGAPWALVSYRVGGEASKAGVLGPEGRVRELSAGTDGMSGLLRRWRDTADELLRLDPDSLPEVEAATVEIPIAHPPKVLCAAANYHAHVREMGADSPTPGVGPYFFFKPPSTTLIGTGEEINIGSWTGAQVDWEAELGVVIGQRATGVPVEESMDAVAGYVVLNDVTDRARLHRQPNAGAPFAFDWVAAKARDRSCPIGPAFVPAFLVEDPHDLRIRLWVNDELKQDSTTADMIWDIPTLIAAASEQMTLEPGDILATGTPAGVGRPRDEFLKVGDVVRLEVEGVGALHNRIAA